MHQEVIMSGKRGDVTLPPDSVVSQFEVMATQSPPIHRAGGAGGALGNPIGPSGPPPACRLPIRLSRPYDDGFPKAPPTPPAPSAVPNARSQTRVARLSCATRS